MGSRPFLCRPTSPRRGILMYEMSDRVRALKSDLEDFMATHIYPSEAEFYRQAEMLGPWAVFPIIEELKLVARSEERREGKESVRQCRSRRSPYHEKKKKRSRVKRKQRQTKKN